MGDLLKTFVGEELRGQLRENYSYLRHPACVYAKVTRVRETQGIYTATLKILDQNKNEDSQFTEIPNVCTEIKIGVGDTVAAILMYGECDPFIVGRCP